MNTITRILLSLLLVVSFLPARGRSYYSFRQIGSDQGLSGSYVKAIAQDRNGFIWLGTKNGLDRFDGISIRSFTCQDRKAGHSNNNIGAIMESADGRLWVGTDRGVYVFDPRSERFTYFTAQSRSGVTPEDWVQSIQSDTKGNIWILVPNQGVFRYNGNSLEFYSVTNHHGDKEKLPTSMVVNGKGDVYVGSNRQGLFFYDGQTNLFRRMGSEDAMFNKLLEVSMSYMTGLPDGSICVSNPRGDVYRIIPATMTVEEVPFSQTGKSFVYSMGTVGNELWIGTTDGIRAIDVNGGEETELSRRSMGERSLSDNTVTALFCDRDGNMWAGTMFGGVTYVQRNGLIFEKYSADGSERGLSSNHLRGMTVDSDGKIWIGTEGEGLNVLDPSTGHVTQVAAIPEQRINLCVESIGDDIYAGFARGGCVIYNGGRTVQTIGQDLLKSASDVYSVMEDNAGNLWIGASWGLYRRDSGSSEFRRIEDVGYGWVCDMHQDRKGIIWIATMGDGVWSYNPTTKVYRHYAYDEGYSNGLRSNSVSSAFEDSKGRMWFSTDRGGMALYDGAADRFVSYGTGENLPDDTVYDILEDDLGYLWFGTNRGLVRFNPTNGDVMLFTKGHNQFNYKSAVKGPDGRFYMGGIDGLIVFNPEAAEMPLRSAPVYFTNLKVAGNDPYTTGKEESILFTDHIYLNPDQGNFSLSIGSPVYASQGNVPYLYRVLPMNEEWNIVANPANLSFAGLPPGDYILEVMRMGDDAGNLRRLTVSVAPPWFRSWWAYIVYAMIAAGLIILAWNLYRRSQIKDMKEKENLFTIAQEKELYKKKMQFFTEIAHEIRTPLTLIGTPLEAIEEIGVKDSRVQRYLKVIRQNTSRLLDLTGQILDFQKMDSERHPLKYESTDITALVREIIDRFELTMAMRSKELTVFLPEKPVFADVDKDAVIKILSNLLNNALKYSERKIEVEMSADQDSFTVTVKSDGEKITGENRLKIFEPFYQMTNKTDNGGVGIGLPLCRTLAHLHGGTIELVDDAEEGSNTFRLNLPLKLAAEENAIDSSPVLTEYVMEEESPVSSESSSYTLLFVDDNEEMREFLNDQLSKNFVVETAADGARALEKLREQRFDIVVTDIMMPDMDGYQLCRAIKDDPNLSPIPVVFLTAKNDLTSKVRALECGGESYIEKPFSMKYFRQQIISLLDNRRHERKAFLNKPFFTVDNMRLNKADEEFMNKVMNLINENIDNESFNVETMADVFCMSRSSLLRKIKNLFNLSPVELIRVVRLKKAAELIQEGKYRMGDICYMVGINSQSYFTRLFFKQFGITPKAFEKQCQENAHGGGSTISPDKGAAPAEEPAENE